MKRRFKIMRNTKSNVTLSATTNTTIDTSKQTPIEIALQIDENGMTTLSALYSFLELNQSHYKRWYNKNIINNDFAVENVDYEIIRPNGENPKGGRPSIDFKLTSDFAKQLSMTVKNERGQEARKYFIACEQGLKVATTKLQAQQIDVNEKLLELLTSMDNRLSKLEEQASKKKLPEKKYSRWKTNTFNKLNSLLSYVNENSDENLKLSEIIHLVIGETEDTYGIEVNDYVDAYKSEFDLETSPYVLDVINRYKDVRDMFTLTLNSILERLHIIENTDKIRQKNIFDELAAQLN